MNLSKQQKKLQLKLNNKSQLKMTSLATSKKRLSCIKLTPVQDKKTKICIKKFLTPNINKYEKLKLAEEVFEIREQALQQANDHKHWKRLGTKLLGPICDMEVINN